MNSLNPYCMHSEVCLILNSLSLYMKKDKASAEKIYSANILN